MQYFSQSSVFNNIFNKKMKLPASFFTHTRTHTCMCMCVHKCMCTYIYICSYFVVSVVCYRVTCLLTTSTGETQFLADSTFVAPAAGHSLTVNRIAIATLLQCSLELWVLNLCSQILWLSLALFAKQRQNFFQRFCHYTITRIHIQLL